MLGRLVGCVALLGACVVEDVVETSAVEQHGVNMQGVNMQGVNMQGVNMQGVNMQGVNMQGFQLGTATLTGNSLSNLRVEMGELVGDRGATTLRGTALTGLQLYADVLDAAGNPSVLEYRVAAIAAESTGHDPTRTGNTFLYTLEVRVGDASWASACEPDADGSRVAIPIAATWDATGARAASSSQFTFGCTTGVIAKCYRWGYRPWLTGYGGANFADYHQACTRMARGDYCGDGTPNTQNGTAINVWDRLPAPGPIQRHGFLPPLGMLFEAGWNTDGAVCLSHARWLIGDGLQIHQLCPDRLVPPGLLGATVCNTVAGVLLQNPDAKLFNESYLNL